LSYDSALPNQERRDNKAHDLRAPLAVMRAKQTASSNLTKTFWTTAPSPRTSSSTCPGTPCPSEQDTGRRSRGNSTSRWPPIPANP